jgi:hypothetical protein
MRPIIDLHNKIQRKPDLVFHELDGEIVMLDNESGQYFGLDPIGSSIWELIEQPIVVNDLIDDLIAEFDVKKEQCIVDVLEFLTDLINKKLVVVIE